MFEGALCFLARRVAQLVEQLHGKEQVVSSILTNGSLFLDSFLRYYAALAQLVEHPLRNG